MMTPSTMITIQHPDTGSVASTTWEAFCRDNDPDTVADAEAQIAEAHYAELGGGASPLVWVFPAVPDDLVDAAYEEGARFERLFDGNDLGG